MYTLFCVGYKIIYRVGIALLGFAEPDLLKADDAGFVMLAVQKFVPTMYDVEQLMKVAFGDIFSLNWTMKNFSKKEVAEYREDYRAKTPKVVPRKFKRASENTTTTSTMNESEQTTPVPVTTTTSPETPASEMWQDSPVSPPDEIKSPTLSIFSYFGYHAEAKKNENE